jgi:hypothetical protein
VVAKLFGRNCDQCRSRNRPICLKTLEVTDQQTSGNWTNLWWSIGCPKVLAIGWNREFTGSAFEHLAAAPGIQIGTWSQNKMERCSTFRTQRQRREGVCVAQTIFNIVNLCSTRWIHCLLSNKTLQQKAASGLHRKLGFDLPPNTFENLDWNTRSPNKSAFAQINESLPPNTQHLPPTSEFNLTQVTSSRSKNRWYLEKLGYKRGTNEYLFWHCHSFVRIHDINPAIAMIRWI